MVRSALRTSARKRASKKGSFYHFFPGKNELVAAAFRPLVGDGAAGV
jgi:AcrR family transcriptional regulator